MRGLHYSKRSDRFFTATIRFTPNKLETGAATGASRAATFLTTGLRATTGFAFAGLGAGFSFNPSITLASEGIGAAPAIGTASAISPGAPAGTVVL